ncbi:MAG: luciferase [Halobacteriales archaeon]
MLNQSASLQQVDFDGIALKPLEIDVASLSSVPFEEVTLDYEGPAAFPSPETLERLAEQARLRVTVPVRADGFDPLGDDRRWEQLPADAEIALVAGNPAYLSSGERDRAIAPRLAAAINRAPQSWVGTEGIERIALATGAPQYELLAEGTTGRIRALRQAGFDGEIAVYAPTVLTDREDEQLDVLGSYVARRRRVAEALPPETIPDRSASGRARDVLLAACADYAIVGDPDTANERIAELRAAGVDHVVGYPARGAAGFDL